jgi:autotransporter-associated beta strand protein
VKIESEGKIEGACGFVILPHLFYGEEELSAGVYDAESLPGKISGCVPFVVGGSFWTGGAEGLWSSSGNWSGGNAAKGGNVAIFTNDATIVAEQFDFGTDGVVIANVSNIVLKTSFSGEGSLRKLGEGRVNILANSDYSGGTQLEGGVIFLNDSKLKSVFGSGNLHVRGGNQFALPSLELGSWGTTISVPVVFSGEFSANHKVVNLTNHAAFNADVSSASDIMLWSGYGPYTINGNIAASGQTVAIRTPLEKSNGVDRGFTSLLNGSIDASLLKKGPGRLALTGNSPVENNMITIEEGTLILEEQSFWGGSVSVLQKGVLRIQGKGNMSRNAVLTVATGGTVEVAEGMRADVASFIVEGRELPPGTYSSANLGCIEGGGKVRVYRQTFSIVIR